MLLVVMGDDALPAVLSANDDGGVLCHANEPTLI